MTPAPALSGLEIVGLVCYFIRSDEFLSRSEGLVISPVDSSALEIFYRELENPLSLSGKEVDSLRYDYCPSTATLTIPSMPTPVHGAIAQFLFELLYEMSFSRFLSYSEGKAILLDFGQDVLLPASEDLPLGQCKGWNRAGTAVKQADAAISFQNQQDPRRSHRYPRTVFEVAFSQSYDTLLEDARHWLVRSRGNVKLVVAIFLEEGPRGSSYAPGGPSQEELDCEEPGAPDPAVFPHSQTPLEQEEELGDDPGPWVGLVTGFLELFRYDPNTRDIYRDGPRYDIYPPSDEEEALPQILITDLLPQAHIEGDKSRKFPLPLELYRSLIEAGRRKLAINRSGRDKMYIGVGSCSPHQ